MPIGFEMLVVMKRNLALLKKRKRLRDIDENYQRKSGRTELEFKKADPRELEIFHEKVLADKRRSTFILVFLAILFVVIAFVVALLLVGT